MAFLIQTESVDKETGEIGWVYAQSVGKTRVKWTPDRDKARRYKHYATAAQAVIRIGNAAGVRANAIPPNERAMAQRGIVAPDPAP